MNSSKIDLNSYSVEELESFVHKIDWENLKLSSGMDDERIKKFQTIVTLLIKVSDKNQNKLLDQFGGHLNAIANVLTTRMGIQGIDKQTQNDWLLYSIQIIENIGIQYNEENRTWLLAGALTQGFDLNSAWRSNDVGDKDKNLSILNFLPRSTGQEIRKTLSINDSQESNFLSNLESSFGPLNRLNAALHNLGPTQPGYIGENDTIEEIIKKDDATCVEYSIDKGLLIEKLEFLVEDAFEEGVSNFVDYGITVDQNTRQYVSKNVLYQNHDVFLTFMDSSGKKFLLSKESLDMIKKYGFFGAAEGGTFRLDPMLLAKAFNMFK